MTGVQTCALPILAAAVRNGVFERSKKAFSPVEHIIPDHPMMKRHHAQVAFLGIHGDSAVDRGGGSLLVIGVDQKCLTHLGGGASKLAKDQNTITAGLAGDVLPGDQVHSIAE